MTLEATLRYGGKPVSYTHLDVYKRQPQNEEEFFQQLEQWNDEDEYTRCIQALKMCIRDRPGSGSNRSLLLGESENCACSGAISLSRMAALQKVASASGGWRDVYKRQTVG